jgi:hypothetical protein
VPRPTTAPIVVLLAAAMVACTGPQTRSSASPSAGRSQVSTLAQLPAGATPDGAVLAPDGDLLVADFGGGRGTTVYRVTLGGTVSVYAAGFDAPDGLAFDAGGALYVSNFNAGTVERLAPDGARRVFARGIDHPSGLAVDAAGTLYVASWGQANGTTVSKVTPDGQVTELARGFHAPIGLAFDAQGRLHVANFASGIIHRVSPAGEVVELARVPNAPLAQLQYLAFDRRGNLYAPALGQGRVYAIDPAGHVAVAAGMGANGHRDGSAAEAMFNSPNSAVVLANGDLVVTEYQSGRVRRIARPTAVAGAGWPPERLTMPAVQAARRPAGADTLVYRQQVRLQQGATPIARTVTITRTRSGADLVLVSTTAGERGIERIDTLVADAGTLRPHRRTTRAGPVMITVRYDAGGIRTVVQRGTAPDSSALAWNGAVFDVAVMDGWVGLLADPRATVHLPIYASDQRGVVFGALAPAPGRGRGAYTLGIPNGSAAFSIDERTGTVERATYDYGGGRIVEVERAGRAGRASPGPADA